MADTTPVPGISVYTPEVVNLPPEISVYGDSAKPAMLDDATIYDRATKYDFALGDKSPGKEQLTSDIQTGNEQATRNYLASKQDVVDLQSRQQLLGQLAAIHAGKAIPKDVLDIVESLRPENYQQYRNDPNTFFEKQFAQRIIEASTKAGYQKLLDDAFKEVKTLKYPTDSIVNAQKITEQTISRREGFIKILEDAEAKWNKEGIISKVYSFAQDALPLLTASRLSGAIGEDTSMFFPGTTREQEINNLWLIQRDGDAVTRAKAIVDKLGESDPLVALTFAHQLIQYSTTDKFFDNFSTIADVLTLGSLGYAGGKFLLNPRVKSREYGAALKDLIKSSAQRKVDTADLMEGVGALAEASNAKAWQIIHDAANRSGHPTGLYALRNEVPGMSNPQSIINGYSGTMSAPRAQELALMIASNNNTYAKTLIDSITINRLTPTGSPMAEAIRATDELFNTQFSRASNAVLAVRTIPQEESLAGGVYRAYQVGRVEPDLPKSIEAILQPRPGIGHNQGPVMQDIAIQMGDKNMKLFSTREGAERAMKEDYGMSGAFVKNKGKGWYIEYHKAVDETSVDVRKALQLETQGMSPTGLKEWLSGYLAGGLGRVDREVAKDMVVATYGSTGLHTLMKEIAKPLEGVMNRKGLRKDFNEFLSSQRDMPHPVTKERGYFSQSLTDFDKDWSSFHGSLPSDKIRQAYFAYTDLVNKDLMTRNIFATGAKLREGIEVHSFPYSGRQDGKFAKITPIPSIEGKVVKEIPWSHAEDAGILIHDKNLDNITHFLKNFGNKEVGQSLEKRKAYVEKLQKEGYKIVQIGHIGEKQLRDLAHMKSPDGKSFLPDRKIHYIITKDLESAPLGFMQVPGKPGGHVTHPNGWFISQPSIRKLGEGTPRERVYYSGDTHLFYHASEAQATKMLKNLNTAVDMLKGNHPEWEQYVSRHTPYHDPKDFKSKFDSGAFDLNTPFYVKGSGDTLASKMRALHGSKLMEAHDSPFELYKGMDFRYMGERNWSIKSFANNGTPEVPHWNLTEAALIDPVSSQLRATSALLRDTYLGDLKIKAANNFVSQFGHLLDLGGKNVTEAMNDPIRHILDPKWRADIQGSDRSLLTAAKNYRWQATNLFGIKTEREKNMWSLQQWMVDQAEGGSKLGKPFKLVEPWLLHRVKDPFDYMKQVASLAQVTFLVPHQMFLQAMTMSNALAWSDNPIRAVKSLIKATYFRAVHGITDNPTHIEHAAKLASDIGWGKYAWNKDHFLESYNAFVKSGKPIVGEEHMYRDRFFSPPLIETRTGKVLDWTQQFFAEGERWNRYSAWSIAYEDWRAANPTAKFNEAAQRDVLFRSDKHSGSMTTANRAFWQQGWASIPTQYLGFASRISEQFMGKEYTVAQKARAFGVYSSIFGVPVATGAALPIWPWHKTLKEGLMERGIDIEESQVFKMMNDGMLGMAGEWLTGRPSNINSRLAPGNIDTFRDIYKGNKSLIDLIGGPAGAFGSLQQKDTNPGLLVQLARDGGSLLGISLQRMWKSLNGQPTSDGLVMAHFEDFINNLSGPSAIRRAIYMNNFGQYIGKNENVILSGINAREKWLNLLAGASPRFIDDSYLAIANMKEHKDIKEFQGKEMEKWILRAYAATSKEEEAAMWSKFDLHQAASGMNGREMSQWWTRFNKRNGDDAALKNFLAWSTMNEKTQSYMLKELNKMQKKAE